MWKWIAAAVVGLWAFARSVGKNSMPASPPSGGKKASFLAAMQDAYGKAGARLPFDVFASMAAYESGWGKSKLAVESHNLTGITDSGDAGRSPSGKFGAWSSDVAHIRAWDAKLREWLTDPFVERAYTDSAALAAFVWAYGWAPSPKYLEGWRATAASAGYDWPESPAVKAFVAKVRDAKAGANPFTDSRKLARAFRDEYMAGGVA